MKLSKKATSIVEAIMITLILSIWITWVYNIFSNSLKFTNWIEAKIQAIHIAKEWIEAIENIRDTNWLKYSSNINSCWKTLNYDSNCILWSGYETMSWKYIIYKDINNKWLLESKDTITWDYEDNNYRDNFKVWLDANWFYTQTGIVNDFKNIYTREINIYNYDPWFTNSTDDDWIKIESIVKWKDNSSQNVREVILEAYLTNYKKND